DVYKRQTLGGAILGGLIGAAGGAISFGHTNRMEDVTQGIGYGVMFGSVSGLILAIVEFILPEDLRGGSGRAMNIMLYNNYAYSGYNFEF
ncbi:MAG: hypothetical protein N2114_03005, partial [Candidatus Goldbacteria bacterium]|nr:hypothetical protein [Candidatus Goldiibacteriota bacterium]